MTEIIVFDRDEDECPVGCECPDCGECRIDYLNLNEDDSVDCLTCGEHYQL